MAKSVEATCLNDAECRRIRDLVTKNFWSIAAKNQNKVIAAANKPPAKSEAEQRSRIREGRELFTAELRRVENFADALGTADQQITGIEAADVFTPENLAKLTEFKKILPHPVLETLKTKYKDVVLFSLSPAEENKAVKKP